jgi:hypothetical protein
VRVQLDTMPLGSLVTLLMRDVMRVPYVISSDVLKDTRPVSVNLSMPRAQLPQRVVGFLRSMGLTVMLRDGTVYVMKGGGQQPSAYAPEPAPGEPSPNLPNGSPLQPVQTSGPDVSSNNVARSPQQSESPAPVYQEPLEPLVFVVIEPAHRSVLELAEVLEGVLPDLTIAARAGPERSGTEIVDVLEPGSIVASGPRDVVDRAVELVRLLDKPRPTVEIRAVVFEVRTNEARSSALSMLAQIGDLDIGVNAGDAPGESFLRIATGGLQAVLSATRGDGRFRIVAEPSLAALSGTVARINSGSQVPTVGSVSYGEDGIPIQSIVYRDSGISLTVRPVVRGGEIELAVEQERSSFERTTTGVADSPTLNRAVASARVSIRPGETIAIAGLDERSEGSSRTGFLGGLLGTRERSQGQGQLLLLLQADLAQDQRGAEPVVHYLAEPELELEEAA